MYVRAEKNHWAKKEEKPVVNQPAHYYKKPAGIKPGTKTRVKTTGAKRTGS